MCLLFQFNGYFFLCYTDSILAVYSAFYNALCQSIITIIIVGMIQKIYKTLFLSSI